MREFKLKKWVAAGLIVSMPYAGIVDAAGLGNMNVLSQLGQPFSAEIDLVNVSQEELATLSAKIAAPEAYRSANLQFNPVLNGMRLAVERRADGKPFIRATSTRPVAEPFLDILIELSWQGSRIVREYSALLDPPGLDIPTPAVSAPMVAAAKPAPAAKPLVTVETPAPASAVASAKPAPAFVPAVPVAAARPITGSEYAVKQGDTLWQIATGMRPEGISLDQMMIGLLRANSDAFINNNINLVKAGKILKVPERDQLAAITLGDATQEVRVHASNWNAYRQKAASVAPTATEAAPATKGRITARVEDKAAATGAKDVVVLSKGDGAAAGKGVEGKAGKAGADRVRALEEDLNARDKALAEANVRVALLEKTIRDMQKLAEIKNPAMAAAQQAGKGDAKAPAPMKAEPPKLEAATAEIPKPEAKEAVAEAAKAEPAPKAAPPAPKKAPAVAPPPPPAEPGIMDTVMDNLLPIGGAAALLAALAGLWAVRRRKEGEKADDVGSEFSRTAAIPRSMVAAPVASAAAVAAAAAPAESNVSDVVDPIEEAQVYIDHGRDNQAEDILKEAMGKDPQRQDVQLKLLEIYATRGDTGSFNTLAKNFNVLTGGTGENWDKATAMGHAIDPSNALYPSTGEVFDIGGGDTPAPAVDLDIGTEDNLTATNTDILLVGADEAPNTSTDILLETGTTDASTDSKMSREAVQPAAEPVLPEFNLDLPAASPEPDLTVNSNLMDFNLDLPKVDAVAAAPAPAAVPADKPADDGGLDFKVDFSGIDLNLDDKPAAGGGEKDAHWNDVQQKFDLARAYQDMGDKDGAREILREVEREGDVAQKAEAQKLLESIK